MTDIAIPIGGDDHLRLLDDRETHTGEPVTEWTWTSLTDLTNWLNFSARKVMPYQRWGAGRAAAVSMIYPVDNPTYSTRFITVLVAVRLHTAAGSGTVTIKTSTDGTGVTVKVFENPGAGGPTPAVSAQISEAPIGTAIAHVEITGDTRELITLTPSSELQIDGFGAWELPPGMVLASGVGASRGIIRTRPSTLPSTTTDIIDPDDFRATQDVDTDVGNVQTGTENAFARNRPIYFAAGVFGDVIGMLLETDSPSDNDVFISLPQGGIYIPPGAVKLGATTRTIRVAVYVQNQAAGGSTWQTSTSTGTHTGETIGDQTAQWSPLGDPYSSSNDGATATVGVAGEWITIQLREDSGANADPRITAICIWDDGV